MNESLPPIRRIVTGDDASGRSRIVEDAPASAVRTVAERPGYRSVNVWRTEETPANTGAPDTSAKHQGILPPKNGNILRIIDFPPESADPAERQRRIQATFNGMFRDATHDKRDGKHPGMHRTATVDYAILLEGEIWAVMDEGETLMRAGDVLVQRGTNHAWANRSQKTARIAFVLIDGKS
ncbi:MAG: cupin domain-containing protein [Betaproteobacteria bacterium]|nr:cupin domain-containing protein [Betaproteobacteria bacterium]